MKKITSLFLKLGLIVLALNMLTSHELFAKKNLKVIYGDDNRVTPDCYKKGQFATYAKSVAGMVPIQNLAANDNGTISLVAPKYQDAFLLCPTERFAQEHSGMMCTGFLVAPDVLVTAGHCVQSQTACESAVWVFEYQKDGSPITLDQVVRCKEIIEQVLDPQTLKLDYAVLRLDRKVTNRKPLAFRKDTKVRDNEDLLVIGHPMGLPQKIADGAILRNNSEATYFTANLDTYGGNSGSPVFNANNGLVEGILVEGEMDLVTDEVAMCNKSNVCPADGCLGEKVTRITSVAVLKKLVP